MENDYTTKDSNKKGSRNKVALGCLAGGCLLPVVLTIIGIVVCVIGLIAFFIFSDEEEMDDWFDEYEEYEEYEADDDYENDTEIILDEAEGWVMYWYLCGSDLESEGGSATEDLDELMEVDLPDNVTVVIQTGGAYEWYNDYVDATKMQRFVYDSDGLRLVDEGEMENMGDAQTLADFLEFATTNYPAEHTIVNLWNHGGGSVGGVAYDEWYDYDALDLNELYWAFTSVYEEDGENPPIDIIGFDACLMATIDTAYIFSDLAQYMVASQETEPSTGWNYEGFVETMAENPSISAYSLAVNICDTYVEGSEDWFGTPEDITLSVVNLSKIEAVVEAYEAVGEEALENAIEDSSFFAQFSQIASSAQNYGGNTRRLGYTNMADLGDLVSDASSLLPNSSDALLTALEDCVEYKIYGELCNESTGLTCYYSYSGDLEDLSAYEEVGVGTSFKYFYNYSLTGELQEEGMEYVGELEVEVEDDTLPTLTTLNDTDWDDIQLTINDDACAVMDLGPEAYDILSTVQFEFYYVDDSGDNLYSLGIDNDIVGDWEEGIFIDNFRGVWGSIDGALCYMELVYEGDNYNEYSIPIYLNGERYELEVIYDFDIEEYSIEGARKPLGESGAVDKNQVQLQSGDVIETIHYVKEMDGRSEEFIEVIGEKITVDGNTSFYEVDLEDGYYFWVFVMEDYQGNLAYSEVVTFEIYRGEIYTTLD